MDTTEYAVTIHEHTEITVWVDATDSDDATRKAHALLDEDPDEDTRSTHVISSETVAVKPTTPPDPQLARNAQELIARHGWIQES